MVHPVMYKGLRVENVDIFYREAGHPSQPAIVLLHGFPSSSHMFRELIPLLADRYHVIAPDYPGYGNSGMPGVNEFLYTFEHISRIVEQLLDRLQVSKCILYCHGYGGPVGFRMAVRAPSRILGFVIQNAVVNVEGLGRPFDVFKKLWADPSPKNQAEFAALTSFDFTKKQYVTGVCNPLIVSPDGYSMDQFFLDRHGNKQIQLALGYDYRTNVQEYPRWQQYLRDHQPPVLVAWGRNDFIFTLEGAAFYGKADPHVETHLLCGGHFMLEEKSGTVAQLIKTFYYRVYGF
ncbi:alpha/beta fold hydrolase [Paenibacillus thalictri]|uniref:Alpha/beta hydrolase n=1 Tax=Paenibacillus thalictri TaxID=2527873 RepID=A0A4Q9E140_9BACL|nr:alpha/beta hydrolase [Paenibacillus thalictri]TBL81978.1 alpha/beta hydrolase [Paenibacillus thalictri]